MRHLDGVRVALKSNGQDLTEYRNQYCKKTSYLDRSIGSRGITLPTDSQFEVLLELGREFQLHGARGVSVVIAFHPDHYAQQGTEYAQVFWIPLKPAKFGSKYTFKHTIVWHEATGQAKQVPFKVPAPAKRPQNATDNWLKEPVYQANHGCLSVHVQRGQVDLLKATRERAEDFKSSGTNVEPRQNVLLGVPASIIRLHWFFPKRGKHGEPYVFEFRNLHLHQVDYLTAGELEFKDELFDLGATEKNSISDEDSGCEESYSEEEEEEEDEAEKITDHRRTQTPDDGSPVKRMRKLRTRVKAHDQVIYRDLYSSSSNEESSDEEPEDDEDAGEEDLSVDDTVKPSSKAEEFSRRFPIPRWPQASTRTGQISKQAISANPQRNARNARNAFKSRQITSTSSNEVLPLNTLSRLPIPPSATIKRKLSDHDDEDQDDEEFLPQVKPEQFTATQVTPLTPNQKSPRSSRDISACRSGSERSNTRSKRARIERDLELLKIRKKELELLNELDELEKEE
ncbi:hypothetical protein AC578_364 [Pseudocercospora eumusae]|uniref:Uncharacterized protein n=1 Tax=Pseudocercospora eumusae TaxID=321146 RepID=A0A139HUC6_9PEZI|nr:hypothetical protein AC578_364 [Pseudocercospora eumusae]